MSRILHFVLFACASAAAALAADPVPDAALVAGQRFNGRFAYTGDVDHVTVQALPGANLRLVVRATGGSQVKPRLNASVNGSASPFANGSVHVGDGGRYFKVEPVAVPASGQIELQISGADDAIGAYRLRVVELLPHKFDEKLVLASGSAQSQEFLVRSGSVVEVGVDLAASSNGPLPTASLLPPSGTAIPLEGDASPGGNKLHTAPVVVNEDGAYTVLLAGADPGTKLKLFVTIVAPDEDPVFVTEPDGHTSVHGAVALADGSWGAADEDSFAAEDILVRLAPGADRESVARSLGMKVGASGGGGWVRLEPIAPIVPGTSVAPGTKGAPGAMRAAVGAERETVYARCSRALALPAVQDAQPNVLRQALSIPTDPQYPQQWGPRHAGFEEAWDVTEGNAARVIAVVDTGVRPEHPDLADRLVAGYDFISDAFNAGDNNGIDSNPLDENLAQGTHGTHVTGIIIAAANNGLGIAGCVHLGKVMPVRVLGQLGGTDFDIAEGVRYAAGLPNTSGKLPTVHADVINLSLGGPTDSSILRAAIQDAIDAGVVIVAAAGNTDSAQPMYPAAIPGVFAVSATNAVDGKAFYSNFGDHVAFAAPGGEPNSDLDGDTYKDGVLSTTVDAGLGPDYSRKSGTSMASPHVASAAFLIRCLQPALTPLQVEAYLAAGAIDIGMPGHDPLFGYGLVNAGRSVQLAKPAVGSPAQIYAFPPTIAFGSTSSSVDLATVNFGAEPLVITGATSPSFWLEPVVSTGTAPCTLSFEVHRDGLQVGEYASVVTLATSAGPVLVPVSMNVAPSAPGTVTAVHVFAVDVVTHKVMGQQIVTADTADAVVLDPLPEGTYWIRASTDFDGDDVVGEAGDYTAELLNPATGKKKFALKDGDTLDGVLLLLAPGKAWKGGPVSLD